MNPVELRARMNATGIGLAGLEGVWWLPAAQPFALPSQCHHQLHQIAQAVFVLFDAVSEMYGTGEGEACGLNHLLSHKVPPQLLRQASKQPVLAVRPDFQLVKRDGADALVATELEICPSAQGFAHALQMGYGLEPDLARAYVQFLDGRELLIVFTQAWSEFIWDQLAFCKALIEAGGRARVLLDMPIETLAEQVKQKQRWVPPMFGIPKMPERWHDNVIERIQKSAVPTSQLSEIREVVPHKSVVFRFGYLDCFSAGVLQQLSDWEQQGATFLNPTSFLWDSKVVMAALNISQLRARISPEALAILDHCIPETHLITPDLLPQLQRQRRDWVLKFAGFDSGQQAWGGRSLVWGMLHDDDSWAWTLQQFLDLPFPTVAQRRTMSESRQVQYFDPNNQLRWNGVSEAGTNTRVRSFLLRHKGLPSALGSHITLAHGISVSESMNAIQTPVVFA